MTERKATVEYGKQRPGFAGWSAWDICLVCFWIWMGCLFVILAVVGQKL